MNNLVILRQMINLSDVIKQIKEIRHKTNMIMSKTKFFIANGAGNNIIQKTCNDNITSYLYLEQYLRLSVSKACKFLDGFNSKTMDPIDYISSSDVKNKYVDICRGNNVVATINLTTGIVEELKPENEIVGEEKSSAENS